MKTLAIIQARCGSKRLPEKVLLPLCNKTVLEHVINRLKRAYSIDRIVVATTNKQEDNKILNLCEKLNINCYRGSTYDVLKRYYIVSMQLEPKVIVRITADCPLIEPLLIDKCVEKLYKENSDVCLVKGKLPVGISNDIFSFSALQYSYKNAHLHYQREHVVPYIYENPEKFKFSFITAPKYLQFSSLRFALDEKKDYDFLNHIFNKFGNNGKYIDLQDVINYLKVRKNIASINSSVKQKKYTEIDERITNLAKQE